MINVYDEDEFDDEDEEFDDDEYLDDLGPDETDQDLLDGTWEERYYAGQTGQRDWRAIFVGLSLLALAGMVVPLVLVLGR